MSNHTGGPQTQLGAGAHDGRREGEGAGENRSVRGDLAAAFNYLKGVKEKSAPCFSQRCMEGRHITVSCSKGLTQRSLQDESG